jgi:hypothetical protein
LHGGYSCAFGTCDTTVHCSSRVADMRSAMYCTSYSLLISVCLACPNYHRHLSVGSKEATHIWRCSELPVIVPNRGIGKNCVGQIPKTACPSNKRPSFIPTSDEHRYHLLVHAQGVLVKAASLYCTFFLHLDHANCGFGFVVGFVPVLSLLTGALFLRIGALMLLIVASLTSLGATLPVCFLFNAPLFITKGFARL